MGKNTLIYALFIAVVIIFLCVAGFFFYQYQQEKKLVSDKISFLSAISGFAEYSKAYSDETSSLNDIADNMNIKEDYTTCMNWVNKEKEIQTKFNENENQKVIYLKSISVNEECNNAISKFSSLINMTKDIRDAWRTKEEKWCYGWHKVDASYTWTEEYLTPLNSAFDNLNIAEENLGNAFSEAQVTCLKQISK